MTPKNTGAPLTDPGNLLRLRDSVYAPDLFISAVGHLDFFSWLGKNPSDLENICSCLRIKERPADVMVTLFKSLGLLEERGDCFYLTRLAQEYLSDSSGFYLGPYISSLKERPVCIEMMEVLRTGKPAGWSAKKDEKEWAMAMEREDFAESFTAGMDSRGAFLAPALAENVDLTGYHNLLDIAGGSGIYASCIVNENPHLLASVLEKPPVDKIAGYSINKRGMSGRIGVIAGDMFKDEFPEGFDVHLFSNVLHDWDTGKVEKLIGNSYRNLDSGGMIMIHDAHLNKDKTGPLEVAEYSVLLMFSTEGRCYSVAETSDILNNSGFSEIKFTTTAANRSVITGRKV